jgi:hypothetical protein
MAYFNGFLRGNRGEATRGGNAETGVVAVLHNMKAAVRVRVYWNADRKQDWTLVTLEPVLGDGPKALVYDGPLTPQNELLPATLPDAGPQVLLARTPARSGSETTDNGT